MSFFVNWAFPQKHKKNELKAPDLFELAADLPHHSGAPLYNGPQRQFMWHIIAK